MLDLAQLRRLADRHADDLTARVETFSLRGRVFDFNRERHLMGVVNLSEDSWYRESVCLGTDAAIRRGRILVAQGAAIIDVGAESSLARAARVDESAQRSALVPVISALAGEGHLVSVETYHPSVTAACLGAGAAILNLTGADQSEEMFRAVAAHDAGVIICFVHGPDVRHVGDLPLPEDPIPMLADYFASKIELARRCGVRAIWIDPGLGFYYRNLQDSATRIAYQSKVFLHSFRLRKLGWPICQALPHAFECFEDEVRCAEPYFAVLALLGRVDLLRTHEISKVRGVLRALQCAAEPG
jgi:dihydropteroate synthase